MTPLRDEVAQALFSGCKASLPAWEETPEIWRNQFLAQADRAIAIVFARLSIPSDAMVLAAIEAVGESTDVTEDILVSGIAAAKAEHQ